MAVGIYDKVPLATGRSGGLQLVFYEDSLTQKAGWKVRYIVFSSVAWWKLLPACADSPLQDSTSTLSSAKRAPRHYTTAVYASYGSKGMHLGLNAL